MADNFDNIVFSSSITIFVACLILIFVYEFFFARKYNRDNKQDLTISKKITRKDSKTNKNNQSDKFDKKI